jgi:hypothetical protein
MVSEQIKLKLSKTSDIIIKVAAVVGALSVIAGGYTFYLNYIWKPTVSVLSVDYTTGVAQIQVSTPFGSKMITLEAGADYQQSFLLGGDWGIKFGATTVNGETSYNRIELTKNGMVYEYLQR